MYGFARSSYQRGGAFALKGRTPLVSESLYIDGFQGSINGPASIGTQEVLRRRVPPNTLTNSKQLLHVRAKGVNGSGNSSTISIYVDNALTQTIASLVVVAGNEWFLDSELHYIPNNQPRVRAIMCSGISTNALGYSRVLTLPGFSYAAEIPVIVIQDSNPLGVQTLYELSITREGPP